MQTYNTEWRGGKVVRIFAKLLGKEKKKRFILIAFAYWNLLHLQNKYLWKHNQDFFKLPASFSTFSCNVIIINVALHSFFPSYLLFQDHLMNIKQNQIDIVEFWYLWVQIKVITGSTTKKKKLQNAGILWIFNYRISRKTRHRNFEQVARLFRLL